MQNIREKLKRRLSHKDKEPNFDDADSADEETIDYVTKEADDAERENQNYGKPGSFLNRLILHGNKKTEDQLAREAAERSQATSAGTATTAGNANVDRHVTQQ